MTPSLHMHFSNMRCARKLLFGGLVVLLWTSKRPNMSFFAHRMFEVWPSQLGYILGTSI